MAMADVLDAFCNSLYVHVKKALHARFLSFGTSVGHHPAAFIFTPMVLLLSLGLGILVLDVENDTEKLFTPVGAQTFEDRARMKEIFPDSTAWNFDAFGLVDVPSTAIIIFRALAPGEPNLLLDEKLRRQIELVTEDVKKITVLYRDGDLGLTEYDREDLCARTAQGSCAEDGMYVLHAAFPIAVKARLISYPIVDEAAPVMGGQALDLSWTLAEVKTDPNKKLQGAKVLKIRFFWRVDKKKQAKKFNEKFLKLMDHWSRNLTDGLEMAYATSESLEVELLEGTQGDIIYFSLTIAAMVIYSVAVTAGGDAVSTRALLACGGVLAAGLGIIGSLGLLSLVGLKFVNFVGIMPFLVIGIGVDDMFLLMSAWAESMTVTGLDVPQRVGMTFAKAGVGITITSLTDFLAFLMGMTSDFIAVRHFCVYTGVAVLLCYFANATLFGACLALHGQRVYSGHHWLTCRPTKSRQQLREEGATVCTVICCGGSIPQEHFTDESICEKLPRVFLPKLILNPIAKCLIGLSFVAYIYFAIWGVLRLQTGMRYIDLVLKSSYYYKYSVWDETYFGQRLAIAFTLDGRMDYHGANGDRFLDLLDKAQRSENMDKEFQRCWLRKYRSHATYTNTSSSAFVSGVRAFLEQDFNALYRNDIILDETNTVIVASRCYLLSINIVNPFEQAEIMKTTRALASEWEGPAKVFVFNPVFVMLEHTLAVIPSTMYTVGTAVLVMFIVTFAFLPQLLMVSLVTFNIVAIMTGVFGCLYFLEITYSGMTMIHLLMSIGFSVDFSAHICAAYLMSDAITRKERAEYAIVHASGPIFNGGTSSLLGVSMLLFSESYFFVTFFWIMSMVIVAGAWHAVFIMPVVLSFIGPENKPEYKPPSIVPAGASQGEGDPLPDVLSSVKDQNMSCNNGMEDRNSEADNEVNDTEVERTDGGNGTNDNTSSYTVVTLSSLGRRGQLNDNFTPKETWTEGTAQHTNMVLKRRLPIHIPLYHTLLRDSAGQQDAGQGCQGQLKTPFTNDGQQQSKTGDNVGCLNKPVLIDDLTSMGKLAINQSNVQEVTK